MEIENFIKKILICIMILLVVSVFIVNLTRAEDNKTYVPLKDWTTQLLYDTTNACYQGTIRWIVLSIPSLIGKPPNWQSQRQMIEHCFCVIDSIRSEFEVEEYRKKVWDQNFIGNLFMTKALVCVKDQKTLPSFFVIENNTDIQTIPTPKIVVPTDNTTKTLNGEIEDSQESPDQKEEESELSPQTIFQG